MEVKIPANIEDMRIKHLPFIMRLPDFQDVEPTITEVCELNSLFTGVSINDLKKCSVSSNQYLFDQILRSCATFKPGAVPLELTFEKTYTIRDDFSKLPAGWFIDIDMTDFETSPEMLPAFVYIEKDMGYAETDKNGNVTNSVIKRAEIFKENLPLNVFLDLQGFFLERWSEFVKYSNLKKERKNLRNLKANLSGKKQSTTLLDFMKQIGMR